MGRLLGMLLLLAGCNQLLGIDDVTAAQDPLRDTDGDGHPDIEDNCPSVPNPDQLDSDHDNRGDACDAMCSPGDPDTDQDGTPDNCDLCPTVSSQIQHDEDRDGIGDECDNCPATANPEQLNTADTDPLGDACDPFPKETAQSTLTFDAFAPYDPERWIDDSGLWSAAPGGEAVISAAGATMAQGLRANTSLGTEPTWYVETALKLGPGLGSNGESMGIGRTSSVPGSYGVACEVLCKPQCQLFLQRAVDTAKGAVVISPGTYVLRLSGVQGEISVSFTCELVGVDKISLDAMTAGMEAGAPAIFATTPTEFMYVHAVR